MSSKNDSLSGRMFGFRTYAPGAGAMSVKQPVSAAVVTGRQALVEPVDVLADGVLLPEDPADAAQPPVIRRARTQFLAVVGGRVGFPPICARRIAFARGAGIVRRTDALIVVRIDAAGVIRIVALLVDVADHVAARIHEFDVADVAVDGQCRVFEPILVVRRVLELHGRGPAAPLPPSFSA